MSDPGKEQAVRWALTFCKHPRCIVLELLQLKICWHEIKAGEVGFADDVAQWALVFVPNSTVQGIAGADIEFGLQAEQRCQRGLRVEVEGQRPVPPHGEILGEVR